jgi:hypothetical protein
MLLQILATLLRPSAGTGQIAGYDLVREAAHVRPLRQCRPPRTRSRGRAGARVPTRWCCWGASM